MSATNMTLFLLLGFSLQLHQEIEGITTYSVTGCSDIVVLLNCSITEMMHVERITHYNGTDCIQAVTDLQVCGQPVNSDTGLTPACNGKVSCNEILYHSYCPGSKAAKVDYRCIPGNDVKDMCDEIIIQNKNRIFLSTPNYPLAPSFTGISPCRCSIRGSNITSIQILELVLLPSNDGTKSSLEINYGDVTYKTGSFNSSTRRVYNKRLSTTSTTAEINLSHNNIRRQYLWIEIQGVSMLAACTTTPALISTKLPSTTTTKTSTIPPNPSSSFSSLPSSSTSSSFSSLPSSSSSTTSSSSLTFSSSFPLSSPSSSSTSFPVSSSPASTESASPPESSTCKQNQDNDKDRQTIIAVSVVLSLCLLLICIAVIVVCILFRKGKIVWIKKPPQVERERNPYSGLDLNQGVAGNDGTYQELSTRNSSPQYNNVSQNNHRDYYNLN